MPAQAKRVQFDGDVRFLGAGRGLNAPGSLLTVEFPAGMDQSALDQLIAFQIPVP